MIIVICVTLMVTSPFMLVAWCEWLDYKRDKNCKR